MSELSDFQNIENKFSNERTRIDMYALRRVFRIGRVCGLRSFIAHMVSLLVAKGIDLFFSRSEPSKTNR